jgi:hypothetical protein
MEKEGINPSLEIVIANTVMEFFYIMDYRSEAYDW